MDVTDQELFAEAIAEPEAQADAPHPEAEAPSGPARDEHGRFARVETPEAEAAPQPQPETAPQPEAQQQERQRVPLAELMEERKTRQRLAEQNEMLMQLVQQLRQPQAAPQPQQPAQPEADPLDALLSSPDKYLQQQLSPIQQAMEVQMEEVGKVLAITQGGSEEAVNAAVQAYAGLAQSDPAAFQAARARVMGKPPVQRYSEMLKWHKEMETARTVGADPNAWFEKTLGEKLNDPAFLASLMEKARGAASQGAPAGGKPATTVQLPPSLSKVPSMASAAGGPVDMSDAGIFAYATGN